jgi:hypothetical protein
VEEYVPDATEDQMCADCGCSIASVIFESDGRGLCLACTAIRLRIPTTDRTKLLAIVDQRLLAGAGPG